MSGAEKGSGGTNSPKEGSPPLTAPCHLINGGSQNSRGYWRGYISPTIHHTRHRSFIDAQVHNIIPGVTVTRPLNEGDLENQKVRMSYNKRSSSCTKPSKFPQVQIGKKRWKRIEKLSPCAPLSIRDRIWNALYSR